MSFKHALRRRLRRARCHGKRRYRDDELLAALHDADYLSWRQGKTLEVYRCLECSGIHVGHRPKSGGCPVIGGAA